MRQLLIQVPQGEGSRVLDIAQRHDAIHMLCLDASGPAGPLDLVLVHISNGVLGKLVEELEEIPGLHVAFQPAGTLLLHPPSDEVPQEIASVGARSPLEVLLGGLQSVGSWKGFLGLAVAAAVTVWIALFTSTSYLLIGAMLIAPFAAPAMNTALATARGDLALLRTSLIRYGAVMVVVIAVTALLSWLFGQQIATGLMVAQSEISSVTVLLPLVAGGVGALALVQSERASLVSAAAVGILVAASHTPPAGMVGMAAALGDWEMVRSGLFLLAMQLVGINLAGTIVFRLYGVSPQGPRYPRGRQGVTAVVLAVVVVILAGMLTLQLSTSPDLQRASIAQRAVAEVQQVVSESELASLVDADLHFTRPQVPGQNTLLGVVYVQRAEDSLLPADQIQARLTTAIQSRLQARYPHVTPLISVQLLEPPGN